MQGRFKKGNQFGRTHGMSKSPEYDAWESMKRRCLVPKASNFHNYGGRGIRVCDEWIESFDAFFDHIGPRPSPKHSLDRIDNDGHYEPGNVRWTTMSVQLFNRRPVKVDVFDKKFIRHWLDRGYSQQSIGDAFGINQRRVSQIKLGFAEIERRRQKRAEASEVR